MVEQGLSIPARAGCGGVPAIGRDARYDAAGDVQRLSVQFGDAGHDVPPLGWSWRGSRARAPLVPRVTSSVAIRSAIMTVGMWVLAGGMSGITDASATERPSIPWTAPAASTTEPVSGAGPMAHVPTGW